MTTAQYRSEGRVALIMLDNPPVNGLAYDVRRAIADGVDRASDDAAIDAIVLTGGAERFSGGADIREFDTAKAKAEPTLNATIRIVEASAKPVVAAIAGICMGGGFELALGCHFRVARRDAQIALPEVSLGLLPGAGGTQRLPRAIGIERALDMIVTGGSCLAERFTDSGLFDALVDGDIVAEAIAFAQRVVDEKRPPLRLRDVRIADPRAESFLQFARAAIEARTRHLPAPRRCVDAVAGAVAKPFDEGLRIERELFLQLMQTPESHALRHAFFAERAAAKYPGLAADTPTRPVECVAVIGAGTMGSGIAMNFLSARLPVTLLETSRSALDNGVARIRSNYEASVAKRRFAPAELERALALLHPTLEYSDIGHADLAIEAVFEDMDVKARVFAMLDRTMRPGAILATNTSTLDVDRIAAVTSRPQDVVGTHFFSPAHVMKLLEIVRGARTAPDVLQTLMKLARTIGKTAVVAGVCDGFIGNRMLEQYLRQATFLLDEGAAPSQVDRALEAFGMAMGPFRMGDLAGNDIGWAIRKRRYVEKPHVVYSHVGDRLCESGRYGQKTGAGWYRYEPGRRDAIPDLDVDALINAYRAEIGMQPRTIADDEIVERCIYALVNEGARLLEEGIAVRASDIDVVYVAGYGFPRHRGGPMFHADTVGLYNVVRSMREFARNAHADSKFWTPAPRLAKLASEGGRFNS
ncbi:MAG TPA: 3-hydroxyacyl-CoA dehydrogenase NAD-binding domain-containing protein [Casimicrobiaceae bacterium]|nr:3-hydroxyacyl-CoA dehydrogenase NAD-binding domain-containing protein [Casimicrobiaceae bacterium]